MAASGLLQRGNRRSCRAAARRVLDRNVLRAEHAYATADLRLADEVLIWRHSPPRIDPGACRCRRIAFRLRGAGKMFEPGGPNTWPRSVNQASPRSPTAERGGSTRSISASEKASCARLPMRPHAWCPLGMTPCTVSPVPRIPRRRLRRQSCACICPWKKAWSSPGLRLFLCSSLLRQGTVSR